MIDQAQALVDELRSAGAARLIVQFVVDGDTVQLAPVELYAMNPNNAGGFSYDEHAAESSPIEDAAVALLRVRYAGKVATGTLLVDETDRIWGEGVHEHEISDEPAGLRVEL